MNIIPCLKGNTILIVLQTRPKLVHFQIKTRVLWSILS